MKLGRIVVETGAHIGAGTQPCCGRHGHHRRANSEHVIRLTLVMKGEDPAWPRPDRAPEPMAASNPPRDIRSRLHRRDAPSIER